jgi:hypothetical protein
MTTFACLAGAGLLLGMFFNGYALIALCGVVALANVASALSAGISQASVSMVVGLVVIQIGYFAGLTASALLPASKPASVPTSRM